MEDNNNVHIINLQLTFIDELFVYAFQIQYIVLCITKHSFDYYTTYNSAFK